MNITSIICYIFPILLYGAETWTNLTETLSKKIEALEMWLYRRILNISWTDRVSNVCVLQRMQKEKRITEDYNKNTEIRIPGSHNEK